MVFFNTSSKKYTIISPSFTNHHNLITISTRVSKNIIILPLNQIKIPTKYFVFNRLSKLKDKNHSYKIVIRKTELVYIYIYVKLEI